jgi:hypothetical protein
LDSAAVVAESGRRCPRCGTAGCARLHARRFRKRITDLSTGDVFERVPIVRIRFCDGSTASLVPAAVWRGRFTVDSVLETVVRVLGEGLESAYDWTWVAGTGEAVVSRRTLGRWRDFTRRRLVGSALSWLGPRLGVSWSTAADEATQLATLLDQLTEPVLAAFRTAVGYAVLDKPPQRRAPARSPGRRIPGRLIPTVPPTVPSSLRRRGAWSCHHRRGPPRQDLEAEP